MRVVVAAVLLLIACDDAKESDPVTIDPGPRGEDAATIGAGGGGGPIGTGDASAAGGAGGEGGTPGAGGTPGEGGEGGGAGGEGGDQGEGGDGGTGGVPDVRCSPGQVRCLEEGGPAIQSCRPDGTWTVDQCPFQGVCLGDRCQPNPAECQRGQRICLEDDVPAVCDPGVAWDPQPRCAEGETCSGGECRSEACAAAAESRSYLGCDYWAVQFPNAITEESTSDAPVAIVVTNPDTQRPVRITLLGPDGRPARLVSEVTIQPPPADPFGEQPEFRAQTVRSEIQDADGMVVAAEIGDADDVEVPPGGLATLLLPQEYMSSTGSVLERRAYRLQSDRPIAAYQFNPFCCNYSFSNDASLLVPTTALGTEYRFLGVPTWASPLSGVGAPAGMAIVGTEDNTQVTVELRDGVAIRPDRTGTIRAANGQIQLRLNAHEVALIQSADGQAGRNQPDLSGSRVNASASVAVFSTHFCSFYPELMGACDHLEEQLFPTGTWGQRYVLVPFVQRAQRRVASEVTYWKILAEEPNTVLALSRPWSELRAQPPGFAGVPDCADFLEDDRTLRLDSYCEFGTAEPVQLDASGELLVMGIMSGQESTGILQAFGAHAGDPSIFMVPPDLQYRSDYAFLVPGTYENDYLTVMINPDAELFLDDRPVDLRDATPVPGSERVFKHIPINDGGHRVNADQPFGILVYAFDDFVSYAFTGGLNLEKR